jgi:hypothetical protein
MHAKVKDPKEINKLKNSRHLTVGIVKNEKNKRICFHLSPRWNIEIGCHPGGLPAAQ